MTGCDFEIRRIPTGDRDHLVGLHRVFGLSVPAASDPSATPIANLLAGARRGAVSIDLLLGAYRGSELISPVLAVESAGGAAMVFISPVQHGEMVHRATVAVLEALQVVAWKRSVALLEILLLPDCEAPARAVAQSGFRRITCLRYLRREQAVSLPPAMSVDDLQWVQYAPSREELFGRALEATYAQSQDCPELTSLRSTANVLAGHRASGVFDPALWWVLLRRTEPVGVLLLNEILGERVLEVDYMGVAQSARGMGVGDALLARAVVAARQAGVAALALAVDQRNRPARRLYGRWGFEETGTRDAWIASPPPVRG